MAAKIVRLGAPPFAVIIALVAEAPLARPPTRGLLPAQVEDLARLSFKRQPLYVGIDDSKAVSTREGLEQGYCVVPSAQRFLLLFTFLKKNLQKKVCA